MKPESSSDWLDLVDRYLNGTLGEEEFAELKARGGTGGMLPDGVGLAGAVAVAN